MDEHINNEEEWKDTWQAGREFADWWKAVKHEPHCALPMMQRVECLFREWRIDNSGTDVEKVVGQANRYYQRKSDDFRTPPFKHSTGWVDKRPNLFAPRYLVYMSKLTLLTRTEAKRIRDLRKWEVSLTDPLTDGQIDIGDESESPIEAILRREMSEELWNALKKHLSEKDLKLIDLKVVQRISSRDIVGLCSEKTSHTTICKSIKNALQSAYFFMVWDKRFRGALIDDTETLGGRNR